MPQLSKATIEKLRRIILDTEGVSLTFTQASEIAYGLVGYWDTLARINSKLKTTHEKQSA